MNFKTDYKAVAGLGSAKGGTGHFISQRLTAIALVPLGILFVFTFVRALGEGHDAVLAIYRHPFNALIAIGFFIVMFRHLRLGLQVVIEDYVHNERSRMLMLITNALIWRGFAVAGAFAVAKIALTV
ncbi:MAG: succinate dehydrogenase, hydrophobic membrane anchor protein [Rhodobacterales bacterium]|jgi:succinate dehydrogenase / fumarate reductase, membrane anchor subunit|nr:succinate dehydrogenase, hydrophobic membrane anchor protein [Pseudomonadota bacterium]MDA1286126.1 succinate dehydrogenase, hydrophobic membrane anchor protein [Pseudomonadota bacterium]NQW15651.1 succinate dehydrogenase, hydrophobic membrane anchor protein [Rhodobacter sp.]